MFENKLFAGGGEEGGSNLLDKLQKFYKKNKTPDDCFPSLNNYDSFFCTGELLLRSNKQKFGPKINRKRVKKSEKE